MCTDDCGSACAHVRVHIFYEHEGVLTRCGWRCRDCPMEFVPKARLEALDGLMRFIPTIAHIVRAGHHRLAKVIDEETTDEEKVALIGFEEEVAALRGEEER